MADETADLVAKVLRDRKLIREDFDIQIEAARRSVALGYYASARAELRGAILVTKALEGRSGG